MPSIALGSEVWLHDRPAKQVALEASGKQIFVSFTQEPAWLQPTLDRIRPPSLAASRLGLVRRRAS